MIKYVLYYYNLEDEDDICFEHEDPELVVKEALRRSSNDGGRFTYRMEAWENDKRMIGSWRFFQNGREFTLDILSSVVGELA